MHSLEDYVIKHSSCVMPKCIYVENGIDINCDECQKRMIAEHDAIIRTDERKKAEQDFQNSDYWNDYLSKVITDVKADAFKEFIESYIAFYKAPSEESCLKKDVDECDGICIECFKKWYKEHKK